MADSSHRFSLFCVGRKTLKNEASSQNLGKILEIPFNPKSGSPTTSGNHQLNMEEGNPNPNSLEKETTLHRKLHSACREEEEYWRQKSRSLWLKAGDKNTNFFHKQAEARKQFNSVKEIHSQNQIVNDFEGIKQVAHLHFKGIYTEDSSIGNHHQVLNLIPSVVHPRSNQHLIAPVTLKEIKLALDSMDSDKAPGPDGFTARFLQVCWPIIKHDLHKLVIKSQKCHKIGKLYTFPISGLEGLIRSLLD
jgi:hypothetical protein